MPYEHKIIFRLINGNDCIEISKEGEKRLYQYMETTPNEVKIARNEEWLNEMSLNGWDLVSITAGTTLTRVDGYVFRRRLDV